MDKVKTTKITILSLMDDVLDNSKVSTSWTSSSKHVTGVFTYWFDNSMSYNNIGNLSNVINIIKRDNKQCNQKYNLLFKEYNPTWDYYEQKYSFRNT